MQKQQFFILVIIALTLSACGLQGEKEQPVEPTGMELYDPENYFSRQEGDSLIIELATYIGVKPGGATSKTRFEPRFRSYYKEYSKQFRMLFLHKTGEGWHYYYLLRPARDLQGNNRGVGGKFLIINGQITAFEELFNTPAGDAQTLEEIGKILFSELVEKENVDGYLGKKQYIQWPDERLKYDKVLHEWRYDAQ
ncbi:MAG: hypothetical protein V2I46_08730 [Bacteroides sp.]|jgi:hypothetical protein|nr:hypothetical protein [Bacteroides sp.]